MIALGAAGSFVLASLLHRRIGDLAETWGGYMPPDYAETSFGDHAPSSRLAMGGRRRRSRTPGQARTTRGICPLHAVRPVAHTRQARRSSLARVAVLRASAAYELTNWDPLRGGIEIHTAARSSHERRRDTEPAQIAETLAQRRAGSQAPGRRLVCSVAVVVLEPAVPSSPRWWSRWPARRGSSWSRWWRTRWSPSLCSRWSRWSRT